MQFEFQCRSLERSRGTSREVRLLQQKIEFEFELDFRESTPTRAMQAGMILGPTKWQARSEMISIGESFFGPFSLVVSTAICRPVTPSAHTKNVKPH
jgi:hypothetical protein